MIHRVITVLLRSLDRATRIGFPVRSPTLQLTHRGPGGYHSPRPRTAMKSASPPRGERLALCRVSPAILPSTRRMPSQRTQPMVVICCSRRARLSRQGVLPEGVDIMRIRRSRRLVTLLLCAPLLAGCPLPIARTEATSAPVVGTLMREDGTPASGIEMGVATGWKDGPCSRPKLRTRTSKSGRFEFPGTQEHYETTWFVPNLDRVSPRYRICASVLDTMRPAYTGYGSLGEAAEPDSVACVAWRWEESSRVSCAGTAEQGVVTGGSWADSADGVVGFYRLFLTEEPTIVRRYEKNKPQDRPHAYVQWVEPQAPGPEGGSPPYRIHRTVSLQFDRNDVWAIQRIRLWRREGRWMASLEGFQHSFLNDLARAELVFELGAPGEVRKVAGP